MTQKSKWEHNHCKCSRIIECIHISLMNYLNKSFHLILINKNRCQIYIYKKKRERETKRFLSQKVGKSIQEYFIKSSIRFFNHCAPNIIKYCFKKI